MQGLMSGNGGGYKVLTGTITSTSNVFTLNLLKKIKFLSFNMYGYGTTHRAIGMCDFENGSVDIYMKYGDSDTLTKLSGITSISGTTYIITFPTSIFVYQGTYPLNYYAVV